MKNSLNYEDNGIINFLRDSINVYGISGNKTLEYIGITIKDRQVLPPKIYLIPAREMQSMPVWANKIWDMYFCNLKDIFDITICDFSESKFDQTPSYRLVIKFKDSPSILQMTYLEEKLSNFIGDGEKERLKRFLSIVQKYDNIDYSPLIQIGIETDKEFHYVGIKYYLTLVTNPSVRPNILPKTMDLIAEMQSPLKSKEQVNFSILNNIENCEYYPTFIGVNDSGKKYECKLYYISGLYGRSFQNKVTSQINDICDKLDLGQNIKAILEKSFEDMHLYPEGIAVSLYSSDIVRVYLKEISPRLLNRS